MEIKNISKKYDDEFIIRNISYCFEKGKVYSIFGKNGIGKTTLLKIISDQIVYDEGEVINSEDDVMYIGDSPIPFKYLKGIEFIEYSLKLKDKKVNKEKILEYFKIFGLTENDADKFVDEYSKGMKYKLIIVFFLLADPKVLLLDEPFVDIDILTLKKIRSIFEDFKKNKTIIITTHISDIASEVSDKILFLKNDGLEEICPENIKEEILDKMEAG